MIYSETHGSGPTLLLIPGGNGDAASFGALPQLLADRFTVVSYDRRGFSRSKASFPVDDDRRLTDDVDDAVGLIDRLPGPAFVLGSSSGAIVGLHLLASHPERVRLLVAHEPPLISLLPDAARWLGVLDDVYGLFRAEGAEPAMRVFNAAIGMSPSQLPPDADLPPHVVELLARMKANADFFLQHELRQYVRAVPNLRTLVAHTDQIVLAGGRDSHDLLPYRPNQVLGERLGLPIVEFPGDHIGYLTHSEEFAATLADALTARTA